MKYNVGDTVYYKKYLMGEYIEDIKCIVLTCDNEMVKLSLMESVRKSNSGLSGGWSVGSHMQVPIQRKWYCRLLTKEEYFRGELDKTLRNSK